MKNCLFIYLIMAILNINANNHDVRCAPCVFTQTGFTGPQPARFCSVNILGNLCVGTGGANIQGPVSICSTIDSTACTNGALVVAGGLGVSGNINACGYVNNGVDFRQNGLTILVQDTNNNLAVGFSALSSNENSSGNVALGQDALISNTIGNNNVALGGFSLLSSATGNNNVAVGDGTLESLLDGNNNIALGDNAGNAFNSNESNNIDIGNGGVAGDQGQIRIGTLGTHTGCYVQGINGVTVAGAVPVLVGANGQLGTLLSSRRFKKDIRDMKDQSAKVQELRPVEFVFTSDATNTKQYGLIAEEVLNVYPDMVVYDANGNVQTVQYMELIPILLKQIQLLTNRLDAQEKKLNK